MGGDKCEGGATGKGTGFPMKVRLEIKKHTPENNGETKRPKH